jgi:hypothetical protein
LAVGEVAENNALLCRAETKIKKMKPTIELQVARHCSNRLLCVVGGAFLGLSVVENLSVEK